MCSRYRDCSECCLVICEKWDMGEGTDVFTPDDREEDDDGD